MTLIFCSTIYYGYKYVNKRKGDVSKLVCDTTKVRKILNWSAKNSNIKKKIHNDIIEYEKGHYRRIINPKQFIKTFLREIKSKIIFCKS